MADVEDDCTPPVPCTREDCPQPFHCICPDDEPCHREILTRNVPEMREELEMPPRE